jgi:hypothetical protein
VEIGTLGIASFFTPKINCINGNSIPIDKTENTIESKIVTKYNTMEALYSFK